MKEQSQAQSSLDGGFSREGLRSQERALAILEEGRKQMEDAIEKQRKSESSLRMPFERPVSGARRRGGARETDGTEYVPLPTAKDYRPPAQLREELERSLREERPSAYEGLIKEYFKRIAQ